MIRLYRVLVGYEHKSTSTLIVTTCGANTDVLGTNTRYGAFEGSDPPRGLLHHASRLSLSARVLTSDTLRRTFGGVSRYSTICMLCVVCCVPTGLPARQEVA